MIKLSRKNLQQIINRISPPNPGDPFLPIPEDIEPNASGWYRPKTESGADSVGIKGLSDGRVSVFYWNDEDRNATYEIEGGVLKEVETKELNAEEIAQLKEARLAAQESVKPKMQKYLDDAVYSDVELHTHPVFKRKNLPKIDSIKPEAVRVVKDIPCVNSKGETYGKGNGWLAKYYMLKDYIRVEFGSQEFSDMTPVALQHRGINGPAKTLPGSKQTLAVCPVQMAVSDDISYGAKTVFVCEGITTASALSLVAPTTSSILAVVGISQLKNVCFELDKLPDVFVVPVLDKTEAGRVNKQQDDLEQALSDNSLEYIQPPREAAKYSKFTDICDIYTECGLVEFIDEISRQIHAVCAIHPVILESSNDYYNFLMSDLMVKEVRKTDFLGHKSIQTAEMVFGIKGYDQLRRYNKFPEVKKDKSGKPINLKAISNKMIVYLNKRAKPYSKALRSVSIFKDTVTNMQTGEEHAAFVGSFGQSIFVYNSEDKSVKPMSLSYTFKKGSYVKPGDSIKGDVSRDFLDIKPSEENLINMENEFSRWYSMDNMRQFTEISFTGYAGQCYFNGFSDQRANCHLAGKSGSGKSTLAAFIRKLCTPVARYFGSTTAAKIRQEVTLGSRVHGAGLANADEVGDDTEKKKKNSSDTVMLARESATDEAGEKDMGQGSPDQNASKGSMSASVLTTSEVSPYSTENFQDRSRSLVHDLQGRYMGNKLRAANPKENRKIAYDIVKNYSTEFSKLCLLSAPYYKQSVDAAAPKVLNLMLSLYPGVDFSHYSDTIAACLGARAAIHKHFYKKLSIEECVDVIFNRNREHISDLISNCSDDRAEATTIIDFLLELAIVSKEQYSNVIPSINALSNKLLADDIWNKFGMRFDIPGVSQVNRNGRSNVESVVGVARDRVHFVIDVSADRDINSFVSMATGPGRKNPYVSKKKLISCINDTDIFRIADDRVLRDVGMSTKRPYVMRAILPENLSEKIISLYNRINKSLEAEEELIRPVLNMGASSE